LSAEITASTGVILSVLGFYGLWLLRLDRKIGGIEQFLRDFGEANGFHTKHNRFPVFSPIQAMDSSTTESTR